MDSFTWIPPSDVGDSFLQYFVGEAYLLCAFHTLQ